MDFSLPALQQNTPKETALPETENPQIAEPEDSDSLPLPVFVLPFVIVLFFLLFFLRKKQMQNREKDVTTLFEALMDLLHHEKLMKGYTGTEEDFEQKLMETLHDIEAKDIHLFMDIIYRAAFSNIPVTEEEIAFVRQFYERMKAIYADKAKGLHKLYYRWKG